MPKQTGGVLITATHPRGLAFANDLNNNECQYHVESTPALKVVKLATSKPEGDFDALLLSSIHAVSSNNLPHSLPIIAVGDETALHAKELGFDIIQIGQGGVRDLNLSDYSNILYPCASEPSFIPNNVTPWPVYETKYNPDFIIEDHHDIICVFSVKAARYCLDFDLSCKKILCLSVAIADVFENVAVQNLATCSHPRYDIMKQLILEKLEA